MQAMPSVMLASKMWILLHMFTTFFSCILNQKAAGYINSQRNNEKKWVRFVDGNVGRM
jgi:hypothetical protein